MKPKFKFEDYQGKYMMHCPEKWMAEKFCEVMHNEGLEWCNGESYQLKTQFKIYKSNTCYRFNMGRLSDLNFYLEEDYTVLKFTDFDWNENKVFTKSDLRNFDVVLRRNGNVEIANVDGGVFILPNGFNNISDINEDFTHKIYGEHCDIMSVRRPTDGHHCLFGAFKLELGELVYDRERDTTVEMTMEEICKALGKNIKIIKE